MTGVLDESKATILELIAIWIEVESVIRITINDSIDDTVGDTGHFMDDIDSGLIVWNIGDEESSVVKTRDDTNAFVWSDLKAI